MILFMPTVLKISLAKWGLETAIEVYQMLSLF